MKDELRDLYIKKLGKALTMEEVIIEHLPHMIKAATNPDLQTGLTEHLKETRAQRARLTEILTAHDGGAEADKPFTLMVETAGKEIETITDPHVRDALIIAAAQAVEHHEIGRYGTLIEWAKELEDTDALPLLKETLLEEKAADTKLSGIAEGGILAKGVNEMAAHH